MAMNNQANARVASIAYVIVLVLSGLILSIPPGNLVFYVILLVLAVFPLIAVSKPYRIFGTLAVLLSLILIIWEIEEGIRYNREREKRIQRLTSEPQTKSNL
jgi:hypothetical protein